jgi:chemotaxis protein MotA
VDVATIIGLAAAFGLVGWSIQVGGNLGGFVNIPAAAIVLGGTFGSLLVHFPMSRLIGLFGILRKTLVFAQPKPDEVINKMVKYAERARREGMLALEDDSETETDEFLRKGLRLAVDGTDPQLLEKIMLTDVHQIENRHFEGAKILAAGGSFAPAFGMIGTLIGLVSMLSTLSDPAQIGAGMATALVTTFYGAVLANTLFLPLAGKLETRSREEILNKEMVIDGIMAIQSGDSPRIVEEKLKSFLPPVLRRKVDTARAKAA